MSHCLNSYSSPLCNPLYSPSKGFRLQYTLGLRYGFEAEGLAFAVRGLEATSSTISGPHFRYGTDGSGGPNNRDRRCWLCSWGISVVALSHDGTWECVGTKGGFLEGPKQTVPPAELRALVALWDSTLDDDVTFSCDSLVTIKNLRRLVHSKRLKHRTLHADLWSRVASHFPRRIFPSWVKSHLSQEDFRQRFGVDMNCAHISNQHADKAAEERATWFCSQPTYCTWGQINRWTDNRLLAIQKHLMPRICSILDATTLTRQRSFGPKPPTKKDFVRHLRVTHPHHS